MSVHNAAVDPTRTVSDLANEKIYRKVVFRIIPFFAFCYLAAYLDRINIGLAKLQMEDDLGFSGTVYGLGAGLFFVAYIIFEVPSNLILQRVGARIWIARIMITWGILSGLTMFVTSPMQFYVLRFLLGVAEAGFVPGVLLYLTYWFPSRRRAKIIGMFMVGLPAAAMIAGPLSGWIMTAMNGTAGLRGWQWLFLIEAIPSVALGVLAIFLLPNSIAKARWLNAAEKAGLQAAIDEDIRSAPHQEHRLSAALKSSRVWLLGTIDMSFMMATYAIAFWLPTLLRDAGATSTYQIGWLTAIPHALAIVVMLLNGYSSDRTRERRWHLVIPLLIGAAGMFLSIFVTNNLWLTLLFFTIANVGIVATYPVFWCLPGTFLTGKAAAAGIALIASIANFGGFMATYVLGWLKDLTHSPNAGMILFAFFLVFGSYLVLTLPARVVNR